MIPFTGRGRLVVAFAATYILWGSTYLAVALALQSLPPFLLMGVRTVVAGLILFGIARLRGQEQPPGRIWLQAALGGLLLFVGCHGTLAYAQRHVPSGLAAVVLATIPFWIVLLNFLVPAGQRPKAISLVGLVPGLGGVALIAWHGASRDESPIEPLMVALLLGSAFSWAAGSVISQRHSPAVSAMQLSGMQLICGGAALFVASALGGELRDFAPGEISALSLAALAYLTVAGSLLAFTAYIWLLDHAPGPLVATYTFVNPIIAIILGWTFLGEGLSAPMLIGIVLVIGSVVAVWLLDQPIPT
jgi:drug/metabolite transporter (DMT)-like permease